MYKTKLPYLGGMEKLAQDLSTLRMDKQAEFLQAYFEKLTGVRPEAPLGNRLEVTLEFANFQKSIASAARHLRKTWALSEPHMFVANVKTLISDSAVSDEKIEVAIEILGSDTLPKGDSEAIVALLLEKRPELHRKLMIQEANLYM